MKKNGFPGKCRLCQFVDLEISPLGQDHEKPEDLSPIYSRHMITLTRADCVFMLTWNLKEKIMAVMSVVDDWCGKFEAAFSDLTVHDPEWLNERYQRPVS
jgi:hypothetical protein